MSLKIKQQNIQSGWKTLTFKDLGISVIDGDRGVNYPNHNDFLNQGHCLFLNAGNVTQNGFKFSEVSFITEQKDKEMGKGKLSKDDLVITTRGTIGNIAHYSDQILYENIRINSGMAIMRNSKENVRINTNFLLQYFNSSLFSKELKRVSFGSAQPQLTIQIINKFVVKIPEDKFEQKRIVAVLGTWDQAIEKLKLKIETKKEIKKGLMQELLTGKTRLQGFNNKWEIVKLSECLTIRHGKSQKEVESADGEYPIFGTGGEFGRATKYLYNKPSVLIGRKGTIDKPRYADQPFWTVDTLFYSEIKKGNNAKYIYYLFLTINWKKYNEGSGVPSLSASTISSIKVLLPREENEQVAIAKILTATDNEIEKLQQKLSILKDQKKYLLNNLVTGTIRTPETLSIPK